MTNKEIRRECLNQTIPISFSYYNSTLIKKAGNMVSEPKRSQKSWTNMSRLDTLRRVMISWWKLANLTTLSAFLKVKIDGYFTRAYAQLIKVGGCI